MPTKNTIVRIFGVLLLAAACVFLGLVFSGRIILISQFHIGPLAIRMYGVFMAAAVGCAYYAAVSRAARYGISRGLADSLALWAVAGGFIGARLYHAASSYSYYASRPLEILFVWNGGLSIYGAVIGGFIALWIMSRFFSSPARFSKILDWLTPSLLLGQIIGRFGNLFNYELYGYPTSLPWGMYVPPQFRAPGFLASGYFHPLFLYEIAANAIILAVLLKYRAKPGGSGALFLWYVLLYNAVRFCLEFLRIDSVFLAGFRQNALVSLAAALLAALLLARKSHYDTVP